MSLTKEEVTRISHLARIEVAEDKKPQIAQKLNTILDWMKVLNEVDTNNVEPLANVHQMALPLAEDIVSDGGITEKVLKNAPEAKYNYFTVPKMI
jgi:aspartyl-tRNA(Asn)/glutamyl-tRNA(Gln) amidotransferase subunit C